MEQNMLLFYKEGATAIEIQIWERLKNYVQQEGMHTIETASRALFEKEHQRLVDEEWRLISIGSGSLSRVSTYVKDIEPDESE